MSYDSLVNRGDYFSAHYLAEVLPRELKRSKDGLFARWTEQEKEGRATPRSGLRALRRPYFKDRAYFADRLEAVRAGEQPKDAEQWRKALHELHGDVLRALGYAAEPRTLTVERAGRPYEVPVAYAEPHDRPMVVAVECGWAPDVDAALDPEQAGRLLESVELDGRDRIETGDRLATWLLGGDDPPRYVLILAGGVIILADRAAWGEGRYLAVSLDVALGRSNAVPGELDTIAALFGADSLLPPEEGGTERLAELLSGSRQHAVGVSKDLRDGLRESVEIIANEVLDRIREQGFRPSQVDEPAALARELGRQSLRYLYRILFLLYAEARPELKILPADDEAYVKGYSMARIGDLIVRDLVSEESRRGFHLYESLDLLFRMVNEGHNPREGVAAGESEGEGLRFEPLKADLFDPSRTSLIGEIVLDSDDPASPRIDTRLRNEALYRVLRLLMLAKGKRKERGGFISYAQLGINQLGAVYEGLMSYTGFIADEKLYEVAKNGDPKDGSWMIPESKVDDYDDSVFVRREDENGMKTDERVVYQPGAFVYRLAGRDRQTSASYYTPESLTQVTVQLALRERLDQNGTTTPANEILRWTICEPALGSGAFLNEAINQVAAEYLKRRQRELGVRLEPERYADELQKVKAYIALHNSYGVDLNETAVELAEVSLWLNVMYPGLQAPWFGLHLRRGNSLIGAGRRLYAPDRLRKKVWLDSAPDDHPFRDGDIPEGHVHHFLLPAAGWGAVAGEKEARNLAPDQAKALADWRKKILVAPRDKKAKDEKASQVQRLQGLARRAEYLWDLVVKRLELSEREISRRIDVWGAEDLPQPREAKERDEIKADLTSPGTPYWRLKTLMDAWCALWFWPLDKVDLLTGDDEIHQRLRDKFSGSLYDLPQVEEEEPEAPEPDPAGLPQSWETLSLLGDEPVQEQIPAPRSRPRRRPKPRRVERRPVIPLMEFGDWLDFAEALLGVADIPEDSLFPEFDSLEDLSRHENELAAWMGMDNEFRLEERFPWLATVKDIAERQGFFHWELDFAHVFQRGGFDLQVGNPPWVRPRWEEAPILAELDPWFVLAEKPSVSVWNDRRARLLGHAPSRRFVLEQLTVHSAVSKLLVSPVVYPLLEGTQPDLYRAFMVRVWAALGTHGTAGLLHPDTHFVGDKERRLRAAAYRRLRVHGDFVNSGNRFFPPPVNRSSHFGLHVYSVPQKVRFAHLSWLFDPSVIMRSLSHDGSGDPPGVKYKGHWDERPHAARVIMVDEEVLGEWRRLTGEDVAPDEAKLLYPISNTEQEAIEVLGSIRHRLSDFDPRISRGYDEANAKKEGLIRWRLSDPESWSEVILKGPQIGVATPFFKQPPDTGTKGRPQDLMQLAEDALPRSEYARDTDWRAYREEQDLWVDYRRLDALLSSSAVERARDDLAVELGIPVHEVPDDQVHVLLAREASRPYTEFYRVFWRRMIPDDTDRSLFPAIYPPGPAHVHSVHSLALPDNRGTALVAGFWAALPVDYLLRITGTTDLQTTNTKSMPAPESGHPLEVPLLLRTLRLNCLTSAYADLWEELYGHDWRREQWAVSWPGMPALGAVGPAWDGATPLRTERERRAALVEIDALVAVWLGLSADQLVTIYRSRYPQLFGYESAMWFDATGAKIAENWNSYGSRQTKEDYKRLQDHLEDPGSVPPPEGYVPPFYKADREAEYRQAHAVFSERLRRAEAEGWSAEGGRAG
ncbi:Eco57I restriction-modification methylase domain-containing protein [Thermomonospora cellulosilytica]|uniref:site-specific DNA-methyltransferase (adenine-specific) n=1 Tax=Thermomonospora cellulosilytica TaxID=1411118 RepID=A0A7W3MVQ6_9ACTN|nr:class I SAM-dependent DNA methyltransferase [Thermomonospora cellulosilytica]MBA9002704.1 hypothetical protein [Thermomonospora cellulosilytica]